MHEVDLRDPSDTLICFKFNGEVVLEASCYLLDALLYESQRTPSGQSVDPAHYLPRWKATLSKLSSREIPDDWAMTIARKAVARCRELGPLADPT